MMFTLAGRRLAQHFSTLPLESGERLFDRFSYMCTRHSEEGVVGLKRLILRSLRQRPEHLGDAPSIRRVREDQPACWRVVFIDLEDLKQNPLAVESRDRFITGAFKWWVHGGFKV